MTERKDNCVGAATVSAWSVPNVQGRYRVPEGSPVPEGFKVDCGTYVAPVAPTIDTEFSTELVPEVTKEFIMPDVYTYLRNAEEKYSTMKTLLYNDQPKPFYSFYVCNRIRFRGLDSKAEDRTARHPTEYANSLKMRRWKKSERYPDFAIIVGTGGLGKSMMMRHLMLDAIANFDDLKRLPVFVPLKDFDATADSLFEYVYSKIGRVSTT
ncbi:MAG: hypothetical protein ACOX4X_02745 [Aminobacterium colombiense]|uniref:hypothetical protein n=1 Tax=Aminobacterium colombiense TaxID=81468 RepID=UPI003D98B2C0